MGYNIWKMAVRNVGRTKKRTFLTSLSICIGIASVIFIMVVGDTGKETINSSLEKLGISGLMVYSQSDAPTDIPGAAQIIRKIEGVSEVMPFISVISSYNLHGKSDAGVLWGVDGRMCQFINTELLHGRLPNSRDLSEQRLVAVVDVKIARAAYNRSNVVGREIQININGQNVRFKIIGVVDAGMGGLDAMLSGKLPSFIFIPRTTAQVYIGSQSGEQILVRCVKDANPSELASRIAIRLNRGGNKKSPAYAVENISGQKDKLNEVASLVTLILSVIAAISLAVAGLGVMNSMLSSVGERQKEIGICKAIGASRAQIALSFLAEATIISLFGGAAGLTLGLGMSVLAACVAGVTPVISLSGVGATALVSLSTGLFFGVAPAVRASKLNPVSALRE